MFMYDDLENDITPEQPAIQRLDSSNKKPQAQVINHDLFDDILQPSPANSQPPSRQQSSASNSYNYKRAPATHLKYGEEFNSKSSKRYHCYVGNLTWWTTDEEIETAIASIGVSDLIDVEIQEFEHNGQSKGYAKIYTGSESGCKRIHAQLGKLTINGRKPDIRNDKQGAYHFEKKINPNYKEEVVKSSLPKISTPSAAVTSHPSKYDAALHTQKSPVLAMPGIGMNPLAGLPPPPGLTLPGLGSLPPPPTFQSSSSMNSILKQQSTGSNSSLSLREFEALVDNNREICSNAISKALDLSDSKDYEGAVECLKQAVNAVQLSKIANDDRSKALIGSVQDTMMSIEEKRKESSVGRVISSKSRRRSRSRSRSRSPRERSSHSRSHKSSKRDRDARSRSPEYVISSSSRHRSRDSRSSRRYDYD